jgi:hypothetical protein
VSFIEVTIGESAVHEDKRSRRSKRKIGNKFGLKQVNPLAFAPMPHEA